MEERRKIKRDTSRCYQKPTVLEKLKDNRIKKKKEKIIGVQKRYHEPKAFTSILSLLVCHEVMPVTVVRCVVEELPPWRWPVMFNELMVHRYTKMCDVYHVLKRSSIGYCYSYCFR